MFARIILFIILLSNVCRYVCALDKIILQLKSGIIFEDEFVIIADNLPSYPLRIRPYSEKYSIAIYDIKSQKWVSSGALWTELPLLSRENKFRISGFQNGGTLINFILLSPDGKKYYSKNFTIYKSEFTQEYLKNLHITYETGEPSQKETTLSADTNDIYINTEKNLKDRIISYIILSFLIVGTVYYLLFVKKTEEVLDDKILR